MGMGMLVVLSPVCQANFISNRTEVKLNKCVLSLRLLVALLIPPDSNKKSYFLFFLLVEFADVLM